MLHRRGRDAAAAGPRDDPHPALPHASRLTRGAPGQRELRARPDQCPAEQLSAATFRRGFATPRRLISPARIVRPAEMPVARWKLSTDALTSTSRARLRCAAGKPPTSTTSGRSCACATAAGGAVPESDPTFDENCPATAAPTAATAISDAIRASALLTPEATPERPGSTAASTAAVRGATVIARPTANSSIAGNTSLR